ncbi:hypothetical protein HOU35_gp071 [Acinetobacter phage vB_AbaM_B09_Aci05]|uniref:Uncharacterized protein n=1 Tax=Acinetobacter phage vB_AbaM_B09_Aci05 TaxID=2315458 RepID=A0A386KE13_9CAUD|nr:hypothetical protein HOU35_gp071 [Acinetobacter phage vB_AbaM_B09_Aci05]AYD82440.1 hypothetical protein Aci05_106 [Acinetobacter phage vB_AbaM_B09_Aci05]
MKILKDFWIIFVVVAIFISLLVGNLSKANASKPTSTTYPPVVAPLSWDMVKKECKLKIKKDQKLPKHCYKLV